jgi:hypothetical protein
VLGTGARGVQEHTKEMQRLEKEVAAATMRAAVAEEQLEVTQQYLAQSALAHQKEVFRLRELLDQAQAGPALGALEGQDG